MNCVKPVSTLQRSLLNVNLSAKVDKYAQTGYYISMTNDLESILHSLGLPPSSQKIYRELLERGETTARFLSEKLGITRPSTYDHLALLVKRGLVVEKKKENKTYFAADDVRHIKQALESSIEKLSEQKKMFEDILPSLLKGSAQEAPRIKFYEGKEGLTYLVNDILWHKGETICTMWPHEEMLKVLGKETLTRFNDRRLQEKIRIEALWPHGAKQDKDYIWSGKDTLTLRKHAPKDLSFRMGYTIYGDKVSFISSQREVFGFIVQSKDFAELMRNQFKVMWTVSK
jgi:sugar-specific transcriptional regulator TrmB